MASEENKKESTSTEKASASSFFDYREFLGRVMNAKYWIILSVLICCGYSYYRFKLQAPVYTSTTEVLFLSGNAGTARSSNPLAALQDLGTIANGNVNMYNEMAIFHSPSLMADVVERLNLNTTYTTDGFGHQVDLYGDMPVIVGFLDSPKDESVALTLRKSGDNHLIATDFMLNGTIIESKPLRIPVGSVVNTPLGKVSISAASDYSNFPEVLYVRRVPVAAMANSMSQSVNTSMPENYSSIMTISYTDINRARANAVVNALVEAYNEMWVEEQNRSAANTAKFINERLAVIEKDLNGIDTDISNVKSSTPTGDIASAASSLYGQSMNYDAQAYEVTTQLSIAKFLRDHITSNPDGLIPANTGASGSIEAQIQEYNKMLIKRDNLLQNSTAANPVIAQMNSDLASNRALILQSLSNVISNYQIQISRAAGRSSNFGSKASSVPAQEKQILSIERQQKVKENLYLYLLQKREETELSRMVTANNIRVLRPASASSSNQMQLTKALGTGILVGMLIPLAIIFLMMQFNTTVTRKSDLANLSVPFLGEMPLSPKRKKRKWTIRRLLHPNSRKADDAELEIVVKERSRSYINEAFRMIRTQLDFMTLGREDQSEVIMLTSFNPGSGKTFISMNLAKSLALKGKKVVVVDVDLRRASLSKYAGNAAQGVSTYLTGKTINVHDLIVKSDAHFGVDVLPVGAIPPNPVELLLTPEFDNLISELKKEYDYVVLDCPPYDLVADTSILARVADMTIFVIRAGLFSKSMLSELEEVYKENRLPHMAVILNGIDPTKSYYNDRYGYKNVYGYRGHSGYYINDDDDDK